MDIRELLYIILQGFVVGSGPCVLICAPVLIPYIAGTQKTWWGGLKATLVFSLTRLLVYVLLGALSGYIGSWLVKLFIASAFTYWVWTFGAGLIIALGLIIMVAGNFDSPVCGYLSRSFIKDPTTGMILLGLIVGVSPCLPLIGIMAEIAIFSANIFVGALYGLAFGIGTVISPMLLLGALAPVLPAGLLKKETSLKIFNFICGALMVMAGVYILFGRG